MSYQNDEVYLKQIFKPVGAFFGLLVRLVYRTIQFLTKKVWLFLIVIVLGILGGYFLDQRVGNKIITQQIVLEPNMKSASYIYDFINSISDRANTKKNLESIGLTPEWIKNIKSVQIEPITSIEDIFDYLHEEYEDRNFQYSIQDFSEKELKREKFLYLYKFHLLEVTFKTQKDFNKLITQSLLDHMYNNPYFKKRVSLNVNQAKESIKNHKASLKFINEYLMKVIDSSGQKKGDDKIVVVASQSETTLLAGLLEQKRRIILSIKKEEEKIHLENEVFSLINDSDILIIKKKWYKKNSIWIPLTLCFLICTWFFLLFIYKEMGNFVTELD